MKQIYNFLDWIRLFFWDRRDIVKAPTLKRGEYYDKDEQMLHVCFALLVNYVHDESGQIDWSQEPWEYIWKEITKLYLWWIKERPERIWFENNVEDWRRATELELAGEQEDELMLIRLMKIRRHLWS